jgi:hypothetical protein
MSYLNRIIFITPKPTKEHLESLWNDVLIDEMKKK